MPTPTLWRPGLRLRILAPAALVAIPAIALLLYANVDRRQLAGREVEENAARLARLASVDQERLIEGTRQLLVAVSENRDVRDGNSEGCSAYLRELVSRLGGTYTNLGLIAADGRLMCSGSTALGVSLADREYFQRAVASHRFTVGGYVVGPETGKASLLFAYPLVDSAGQLQSLVFATLDLERLNRSLAVNDWPRDTTVMVTDREHTVVAAHPDWHAWVGKSLKNDPVTSLIGARNVGVAAFAEGGDHEVIAFHRIARPRDAGLTVRVLVPKTRALAVANRTMLEGLLGIGLIAVLVMIGVKVAADGLIMRPIAQLTGASRRLAAGDLSARAASSTTIPELNELGKDFDDMAAALEEREAARVRAETERKELEQQFYQTQKMDAVGRLAGGIAHDFNNMLTAILGYCELLLEDPTTTPEHRRDIREIEKAGRAAAALTRQLLAFSRREIVEPTVLDLNAIVGGMEKTLQRVSGEHISLETHLRHDLDRIRADRGQIELVILNLVENARDAMPGGGQLSIETSNINATEGVGSAYLAAPPGRYVVVTVTDTGTGMPLDVQTHLFEPFFTTKRTGKGTGLGLATVYGMVKQAGGGLTVQSEAGKGSVFRVYFPRCAESAPVMLAPTVTEERPADVKATILVVEDDAGIRALAGRVLARHGYRVLSAAGGEEARTLCEQHQGSIDLLLSDVVMPGMNGPMVAAMVTRMRPAMKVLYMSGYTDDMVVRQGVMANDVPFLQKPFTPERLANKILEVLG